MKVVIRAIVSSLALLLCISASAQSDFKPRMSWTYIFADFKEGTAFSRNGETYATEIMNITVPDGRLRFVQDGSIKEVEPGDVDRVEIGAYTFINVMGHLYQVAARSDEAVVLYDYPIDREEMEGVDIGYGGKSTTVSASTHMVDGLGNQDVRIRTNKTDYAQAVEEKSNEGPLYIKQKSYIYVKLRLIEAMESTVVAMTGVDKKALKNYMKAEKLKWSKPEDLLKIGDWLASQL